MTQPHARTDVIVVGAGIVGICCALSIAERGKRVRLVDRDEPGQGCSYGNAGVISPWSLVPQSTPGLWKKIPGMVLRENGPISITLSHLPRLVPWGVRFLRRGNETRVRAAADAMETLNQFNVALYRRHLAGTGHEHLVQDSWYVHAFRDAAAASVSDLGYRIRAEKGAEIERIGADALRTLEPALSHDFQAAILIKGQARAVSPGTIATVLCDKARGLGVEVTRGSVQSISETEAGAWRVGTDVGDLQAEKVVVSAGAWSADLLEAFGVDMPLAAERGYHVEFRDPGIEINNSIMDVDMMAVASSMANGVRVAGTAEFTHRDAPANPARIAELTQVARRLFPDLNTAQVTPWMGARPSFPDSLPMLGEFRQHKGLYSAFGHSHYGLMMAPKTGEIIADLVADRPPNIDLEPYAVERF